MILTANFSNQSVEAILHLDLLAFESLHGSVIRLKAQQARETAWANMMAAQGTSKGMKELDKHWKKLAEQDLMPEGASDVAAFLQKFGKGI